MIKLTDVIWFLFKPSFTWLDIIVLMIIIQIDCIYALNFWKFAGLYIVWKIIDRMVRVHYEMEVLTIVRIKKTIVEKINEN